jgi:dipeptidyl aminopeptidase/acylaminoacyl peptidase
MPATGRTRFDPVRRVRACALVLLVAGVACSAGPELSQQRRSQVKTREVSSAPQLADRDARADDRRSNHPGVRPEIVRGSQALPSHRSVPPPADVVAFVDSFCPSFDESCVGGSIGISRVDGSRSRLLPVEGRSPALSPDGSRIAFDRPGASCPSGCGDLYVVRLGNERHPRKIAENARSPVWSPDGTTIAFERKLATCFAGSTCSDLWTVRPDGSAPTLFIQDARAFAWSPDGSNSVFVRAKESGIVCSSELWVGNQGNDPSPTYRRMTWAAASQVLDVAWSPDGERLAIARHESRRCQRGDKTEYALYVMDVDGTKIRKIAPTAVQVAWEPGGERLLFERVNCTTTFCPPPDLASVDDDGRRLTVLRRSTAWPAAAPTVPVTTIGSGAGS